MSQSLLQFQKALARLYTDASFRELFFSDPIRRGAEAGLDPETIETLRQLCPSQVNGFAASLRRKRSQEMRKFFPWAARVLGEQTFHSLFNEFQRQAAERRHGVRWMEALAFLEFLLRRVPRDADVPGWWTALVRFEICHLKAFHSRRVFRCFFSRWPVLEISRAAERGAPFPAEPRRTAVILLRPSPGRSLRVFGWEASRGSGLFRAR